MQLSSKILTYFLKFYLASAILEGEESATIDFKDRNDTEFEESPTLVSISLNKGCFPLPRFHSFDSLLRFQTIINYREKL